MQFGFPIEKESAEFGFAEPRPVRQYGRENRLQFAWRARDHAQHLGCRALLLPRLGEFTSQAVELFLHIGGRGTATARGSGLVAAFELRHLTFRSGAVRQLPRPTTSAIDVTTSGRFSWSLTTFRITPEAPKPYHLLAEIAQCAVLRPRMTRLGHNR